MRNRLHKAYKALNFEANKTFEILGCSISFFERWIIHQIYGNMTLENHDSLWESTIVCQ